MRTPTCRKEEGSREVGEWSRGVEQGSGIEAEGSEWCEANGDRCG